MLKHRFIAILLSIALFTVTACSNSAPSPDAGGAVATMDTGHIVEAVLAEVETRLVQETSATEPVVDPDDIAAAVLTQIETQMAEKATSAEPATDPDDIVTAVLAEVEARLAQQTATRMATVDTEEIVAAVLAEVESQLAQESEIVRVADDDTTWATATAITEETLTSLYQQANPAVVYIIVPPIGSGSGFLFSEEGYIVTNNHVVESGRSYEVVFANGERRNAELIGTDPDSDLAVIQVDQLPGGVEPLPLAPTDDLRVGQFAVAIGNPFGEQGSMSLGIVSGLDRSLPSQRQTTSGSTYSLPQVIQTDAPINPGNSGGPLLNLAGEVLGVNSAIATSTGTNSGVGFSIPVAAVRQIVPSLIAEGEYKYPYMGVGFDNEISLDEQSTFDLPQTRGAYVVSVTQNSPADEAGLIPASPSTGRGGDLIVKIDDREINDFSDLNSYLVFHTTVGQSIDVTVLRDGELVVLPLTLGARPK